MTLADLQPKLFEFFQQIVKANRLSHAYLFAGDFGSFDMALWLAKSLFCEDKQEGMPCHQCRSCRLIMTQEFSDVKVIEPQGQVIKTETVRELTRDFSRSGFEGQAQVFIIKDADKMHTNAANSLLKFIEEPQSQSYMILLTSDESKVLPTIKSRCQIYRFPKQVSYLQEQLMQEGLLKTQALILAELAADSGQAIALAQNTKVLELVIATERFVKQLLTQKDKAYLEAAKLGTLATDKDLQELALGMLTIYTAQHRQPMWLTKCHRMRQMWQANVSFQNALEYLVIS